MTKRSAEAMTSSRADEDPFNLELALNNALMGANSLAKTLERIERPFKHIGELANANSALLGAKMNAITRQVNLADGIVPRVAAEAAGKKDAKQRNEGGRSDATVLSCITKNCRGRATFDGASRIKRVRGSRRCFST